MKKLLKDSDLIISSNEYFKNTKEAILLSDLSGVKNFYIVSLSINPTYGVMKMNFISTTEIK